MEFKVDHRGYVYEYDMENRLTKVSRSDSTVVATFAYDALGRRIEMVDYDENETVLTTRRYYYDDQRVAVQTDYDAIAQVETDERYFVFGNYIDEVLMMHDGTDDLYYAHDHLYSPVALFADNGTVAERYEYDAYGQVQVLAPNYELRTTSLYANAYSFTGRELDTLDAGSRTLMYYRARTYDPETGRFMQRDPLEYINGINFYLYVLSNPLNNSDPLGLMSMRIRPAPPKRTRPTHSSHVGDDWPSRGIYEADICEKGCYAHCYEMVTEYNYTGALVGHELTARGLTMEVIKAILEGIAKGTGGGLSPGARYAFPVIFEKRVSSHEYFHIDCKKNEIYRERRFTETTYNSDVDQTFTFTPVYGKVSRGDLDIFRTIIEKKKPQVSYDRWSTDGSVWHGAKLDYIESYCTTNNTKDYEFPSEYFPGPGYELVNMKPEEYYKPK